MATILLYHRVIHDPVDPLKVSVDPQTFESHIEALRNSFEIVPLQQLLTAKGRDQVAITFDDGYYDLFEHAIPLLRALRVPATFFLITGYLLNEKAFWWERLRHQVLSSRATARPPRHRLARFKYTFRRMRRLPLSSIEKALSVEETFPADSRRSMTKTELLDLASTPHFSFGSHSVWHQRLSRINEKAQKSEVHDSKWQLEAILSEPVRYFAYPYGDRASFTPIVESLVEKAGYDYAFVNFVDDGAWNRFRIPRLSVGKWSSKALIERVRQVNQY